MTSAANKPNLEQRLAALGFLPVQFSRYYYAHPAGNRVRLTSLAGGGHSGRKGDRRTVYQLLSGGRVVHQEATLSALVSWMEIGC